LSWDNSGGSATSAPRRHCRTPAHRCCPPAHPHAAASAPWSVPHRHGPARRYHHVSAPLLSLFRSHTVAAAAPSGTAAAPRVAAISRLRERWEGRENLGGGGGKGGRERGRGVDGGDLTNTHLAASHRSRVAIDLEGRAQSSRKGGEKMDAGREERGGRRGKAKWAPPCDE